VLFVSQAGFADSDYMPQPFPSERNTAISAGQLSALLDSARELHAILSADGAILFVSSGFTRVLGYQAEELVGRPITAFLHPNEVAVFRERLRAMAATTQLALNERCRLRSKNGSWRWFEAAGRNALQEPGIDAMVVSFLDISDLRRMEQERQVISDVVHALNQTSNLDQLLGHIHQALKKVLYAENCFVALHDAEEGTFYCPFFADQYDSAPPPQKLGRSCTAFVFRTGRARVITQSDFDHLAEQGEVELVGSPSSAWLGVPLKTPTATIGVLAVQHYENECAYDLRDLQFLESVGGQIALAIERRRAEEALRKSESMLRLLFENNPLATWVHDTETLQFLRVNDAAVRQYGFTVPEFEAMTILDIRSEEERAKCLDFLRSDNGSRHELGVWKHQKKDGKIIEVEIISHQLDYAGRAVNLVVARDISERRQLEEQLRQAQKMEAIGRLAGGVAHDFNNLLMVIKGHTELLLNVLPPADHVARKIEQIDRAADRAASLTCQLLAFSRRQVLQPRVMSLNGVVEDMGRLLPRLIGEDVELVVRMAPDIGAIRADANQVEQIIMNLAVNARDAMPGGGRLVIETSNAVLDHTYAASHPGTQPGCYVLLTVSDSGAGMDAETLAHVFEPFFTTKEQGKGTGLGLATVYGVVKQSGGYIGVHSELGKGTCFNIYFPRVDQPAEKTAPLHRITDVPRGTETVLLAEDEQDVREVAREFLESGGYKVLEARDGAEALRVAKEHAGSIDLLVTDMVMPGMNGSELAALLQQQCDGVGVIYMSGYSEHAVMEAAKKNAPLCLLAKPFSRGTILRTVREALAQAREH
jgi:two-component system cell cycle sensor histidine kinase/response regulator CckA